MRKVGRLVKEGPAASSGLFTSARSTSPWLPVKQPSRHLQNPPCASSRFFADCSAILEKSSFANYPPKLLARNIPKTTTPSAIDSVWEGNQRTRSGSKFLTGWLTLAIKSTVEKIPVEFFLSSQSFP